MGFPRKDALDPNRPDPDRSLAQSWHAAGRFAPALHNSGPSPAASSIISPALQTPPIGPAPAPLMYYAARRAAYPPGRRGWPRPLSAFFVSSATGLAPRVLKYSRMVLVIAPLGCRLLSKPEFNANPRRSAPLQEKVCPFPFLLSADPFLAQRAPRRGHAGVYSPAGVIFMIIFGSSDVGRHAWQQGPRAFRHRCPRCT